MVRARRFGSVTSVGTGLLGQNGVRYLACTLAALLSLQCAGGSLAAAVADLSNLSPKRFDPTMRAELETYIGQLMQRRAVPGAAVAIVQGGSIVLEQGFGVREIGKPGPVTAGTLMMIGSTGKSMTTLMMATVVDDGKMQWDTPAAQIDPDFAVSDPGLTPRVTMRHLVCNCTGIGRHDLEDFFPGRPRTAEDLIRSLRAYPFIGTFGATFQYSNQMVATGGYLAARAASGSTAHLYAGYVSQMQHRVFDRIGMSSTTFSLQVVQASPNHATPHGRAADYRLVPLPVDVDQSLDVLAPAGASWSNVHDLGRYLITQLNGGLNPEGRRVVSAENLKRTWQQQVQVKPGTGYALGWGVTDYKGVHLLTHNGGTSGFSSILAFLPEVNLGVAVLSNAQDNDPFDLAVLFRVFELVYGLPMEADARFDQIARKSEQDALDRIVRLEPMIRPADVTPYLGAYANPQLGTVTLAIRDGRFVLEAGDIASDLRSIGDATYVLWDPPLAGGLTVHLTENKPGRPEFSLVSVNPSQPETYAFIRRKP